MRNPDRLDAFYKELCEIHKKHVPDWRFGQFMCNVLGGLGIDPFFPEETKMIELIRKYFEGGKDEGSN